MMITKQPVVYIMASKRNGTLYTGVTSHLQQRVWQHRQGVVDGFSKKYNTRRLVYYELHGDMYAAISREKQIKKWRRQWKLNLIEGLNPQWLDLWNEISGSS